ncbi:MAG: hypothetical protein ABI442_12915 [Gemmatimonadaceae bacterium]
MISLMTLLALPALATAPAAPATTHNLVAVDSVGMALVVVQNDRTVPVTLYLETDNGEIKLGVVAPLAESTMRIPDYLSHDDVQFFAHPEGQIDQTSGYIDLRDSQRVGLVIPPR